MVDSKFLIVTTLCYVGIFGVIFIVCCCAWMRHRRNESRGLSSRQRSNQTNRRFYRPVQPPEYHTPSTPMPYGAPRGNAPVEIQNVPAGNTYFPAPQMANNTTPRNNILYPMAGHFPNLVFTGFPRGNLYPANVTTGTHAVQITTFGETVTSQGGCSGDNFSDATSSRFGGGDNTDDKNSAPLNSTRSRTTDSEREAESDVSSSQASHFQEITLREERC